MTTLVSRVRPFERASQLDVTGDVPAALLGAALVAPVASVDGGWAATSWGWTSLALAWVAVVAILLRRSLDVSRLELATVGALAAFAGWTVLSAAWSGDAGGSVLSFERVLVYVTALAAAFAVVQARSYRALAIGVWAAATLVSGYAALTRLYPDRFHRTLAIAGNRLAAPVGYWNSLGLLAAVGILVALGLVASRRSRPTAALAGASLVPLWLACYFTFSRGAWLVLAFGLVLAFALDPRRLRFALAAAAMSPWIALTVGKASQTKALTTVATPPATASAAGARLAYFCLAFVAAAALTALALGEAGRRVDPSRTARRAFAAVLAAAVLAGVAAVGVRYGSPATVARKAWHSFTAKPQKLTSNDLNARLFTFSNNGRIELWRVAARDWRAHPVLGSGAGTFQRVWLRQRPTGLQVVNAHSLYLETLAELGLPGLALLLAALAAPLAAAWRVRRRSLVPAAASAYAAFLLHAAFDWDWQLPGVALAPLLLGAGLLVAARSDVPEREPRAWSRYAAAGALVAVAALAGLGLLGNRAAASAARATSAERWDTALAAARRAERWQPWSSEPWRLHGEAYLQQGQLGRARRAFHTALAKSPDSWQLWLDLAFASETPAARRAAAERALALNPHSTEIARIRPALGLPPRPKP